MCVCTTEVVHPIQVGGGASGGWRPAESVKDFLSGRKLMFLQQQNHLAVVFMFSAVCFITVGASLNPQKIFYLEETLCFYNYKTTPSGVVFMLSAVCFQCTYSWRLRKAVKDFYSERNSMFLQQQNHP